MLALNLLIELQTQINEQPDDIRQCFEERLARLLKMITECRGWGIPSDDFLINFYNYCFMQEGGNACCRLPKYLWPLFKDAPDSGPIPELTGIIGEPF